MPDITAISAGLGAIKQAIEITRELRDLGRAIESAELKLKIAELADALVEAKLNLVGAKEEISLLKEQIREIKQINDYRKNITLKKGLYYFNEPVEGRALGPYCPRCLDVDDRLVIITKISSASNKLGNYQCQNCKAIY